MTPDPAPALLGPAEVRELAGAPRRPAHQDPRARTSSSTPTPCDASCATAEVGADDHVVEVGPGLGSLTLALLPEVASVTAVEVDPLLAGELPATVARHAPAYADRLTVVTADALRLDTLPGPAPTALVANLPYNISVPVLLHLLERFPSLRRVLVMVQAEVADRLAAPPGQQGLRRAVRQGAPGTPRCAARGRSAGRCSGRRRTSTPAWSP